MAKIRDDLDGVVYVEVEGERRTLTAGDEIPEGVELGEHLTGGDSDAGKRAGRRGPATKVAD